MSWLANLFGGAAARGGDGRWVVLDVESSGLDAQRDRLLAVAAIALHRRDGAAPRIALGDSFEVVLRQPDAPAVDKQNILLHGIGVGAQREGVAPQDALAGLERWIDGAPLIAFHAAFDETMIQRAMAATLGRRLGGPWLDLEHVAEALLPAVKARSLDEWMAHFGIVCAQRHQAAADTLATAELLLKLWPQLQAQRAGTGFDDLLRLARQRRWLPKG